MKKLLVFLCVVIMVLGVIGCKDEKQSADNSSSFVASSESTSVVIEPLGSGGDGEPAASVPEPATILLLGSGMLCIAMFGRKKFKK